LNEAMDAGAWPGLPGVRVRAENDRGSDHGSASSGQVGRRAGSAGGSGSKSLPLAAAAPIRLYFTSTPATLEMRDRTNQALSLAALCSARPLCRRLRAAPRL
jgi:hypothetical protein